MIDSGYKIGDIIIKYEVVDNGFKLYMGNNTVPSYYQYEPYIPDPSKSYEENALLMCKQMQENHEKAMRADRQHILTESDYSAMRSDLDYLMLLNDPDSAFGAE